MIVDLPMSPRRVLAFGLTYASHLRETGSAIDLEAPPVLFEKNPRAISPAGADTVAIPTRDDLLRALGRYGRLRAATLLGRAHRRFVVAGSVIAVEGGVLGARAVTLTG